MTLGPQQLELLAASLAKQCGEAGGLITPDSGRRVYRQIWDHPAANAWLIAWCPGHDTGWHDHDDAGAAITVLRGEVIEERMQLGGGAVSRLFSPSGVFLVPPTAIHRVRHTGLEPAVTLHCYSPPLRRQGTYSVGPDGDLLRTAESVEKELRADPALV